MSRGSKALSLFVSHRRTFPSCLSFSLSLATGFPPLLQLVTSSSFVFDVRSLVFFLTLSRALSFHLSYLLSFSPSLAPFSHYLPPPRRFFSTLERLETNSSSARVYSYQRHAFVSDSCTHATLPSRDTRNWHHEL